MFAGKIKAIAITAVVGAIAGVAALAGPSKAQAGIGGDGGKHYIISTCTTKHINVDINAASAFNGQQVATRVWDRVPGGTWTAMTAWHYNTVNSQQTFDDGFGSPITSTTPKYLYSVGINTTGGYRQIGVEFYWMVNGVWTGYDFLVETTYNQGSPIGFLTTGTCVT